MKYPYFDYSEDYVNANLYYAALCIVDYLALCEADDEDYAYLIECLKHLDVIGDINIEAFIEANDCGDYFNRNNIEDSTWDNVVKAFRDLFERGDRIDVRSKS